MSDSPGRPTSKSIRPDGGRVKTLCLARGGWTQEELAARSGLGKRTVEKVWNEQSVSLDSIKRVAAALGVSLAEVVCGEWKQLFREVPAGPCGPPESPAPAATGVVRPAQLPPPVPNFVGRQEEMRRLTERLHGASGVVELTAVRGMGGVGKTSLAVEVGHVVRGQFPAGQVFIDLKGMAEYPLSPARAMARVIQAFHPERRVPETSEDALPVYRSVLADAGRVLVVLDNADTSEQVRDLLVGPPTGVLITSRRTLALGGVESVRLDELSPAEAALMLNEILGDVASPAQFDRLAAACGRLPLALRVAGDFLRVREDWTVEQYVDALRSRPLDRLKVADDPQRDVERVLRWSAEQLVRESPELATRWQLLSELEGKFDADDAAAMWRGDPDAPDLDPTAVRDDLSELVARSMVQYDRVSGQYELHDLMRPIAAGLFGQEGAA